MLDNNLDAEQDQHGAADQAGPALEQDAEAPAEQGSGSGDQKVIRPMISSAVTIGVLLEGQADAGGQGIDRCRQGQDGQPSAGCRVVPRAGGLVRIIRSDAASSCRSHKSSCRRSAPAGQKQTQWSKGLIRSDDRGAGKIAEPWHQRLEKGKEERGFQAWRGRISALQMPIVTDTASVSMDRLKPSRTSVR